MYLSIRYFIWCTTRYTMRWACVPRKVASCTKFWGAQSSPEFALRSTDFCAPKILIFPVLVLHWFFILIPNKCFDTSASMFSDSENTSSKLLNIWFCSALVSKIWLPLLVFHLEWLKVKFFLKSCLKQHKPIHSISTKKQNYFVFSIVVYVPI